MNGIAKVDDASSFLIAELPSSSSMWQFAVVSCDSVGLGDDFRTWPDGSSTTWAILWQLIGDANLFSSKFVMCRSSMYFAVESWTLWLEYQIGMRWIIVHKPRRVLPTRRCRFRQLPLSNRFCDVSQRCRRGYRWWLAMDCRTRSAARAPRTVGCRTG